MALHLLRETMRLHLLDSGARLDMIDSYLSRWDTALESDGATPLPGPDCYADGVGARLHRVSSPAGGSPSASPSWPWRCR